MGWRSSRSSPRQGKPATWRRGTVQGCLPGILTDCREVKTFDNQRNAEQTGYIARRDLFLAEMDKVIPWKELSEVIEPFYPKPDGAGRPPVGLEHVWNA